MRLPRALFHRLQRLVDTVPARRAPDVVINPGDSPYLSRWRLTPRNPVFNIYLHQLGAGDDDKGLHSHPWMFHASVVLRGGYLEHLPDGCTSLRIEGNAFWRWGSAWHRVELLKAQASNTNSCWTLFITGPQVRLCPPASHDGMGAPNVAFVSSPSGSSTRCRNSSQMG